MKKIIFSLSFIALTFSFQSCRDDDSPNTTDEVQLVKENYANIVLAGY